MSDVNVTLYGSNTTGTVVDQYGNPVSNATVRLYSFDYSNYSGTLPEIQKEVQTDRESWNNPEPSAWTDQGGTDLQLTGAGGTFATSEQYVAVHPESSWGALGAKIPFTGGTRANVNLGEGVADVSDPVVNVDPNSPIVLSVWRNPKADSDDLATAAATGEGSEFQSRLEDQAQDSPLGGLFGVGGGIISDIQNFGTDPINRDLPGHTTTGAVEIEKLSPAGSVLWRQTYDTEVIFKRGSPTISPIAQTKTHEGVRLDGLSPGFYRVSPASGGAEYVIVAGDPDDIGFPQPPKVDAVDQDKIEEYNRLQNAIDAAKVTQPITVTTDSDGTFSADVSTLINETDLIAYRCPPGFDLTNCTRTDIRQYYRNWSYENGEYDGDVSELSKLNATNATTEGQPPRFYSPASVETVNPPASGIKIRVVKVHYPGERAKIPQPKPSRLNLTAGQSIPDFTPEQCSVYRNVVRTNDVPSAAFHSPVAYNRLSTPLQNTVDRLKQCPGNLPGSEDTVVEQPNATEEILRDAVERGQRLLEANQEVLERTRDVYQSLPDRTETNISLSVDLEDLNRSQLDDRLMAIETALGDLQTSLPTQDTSTTVDEETISTAATFSGAIHEDDVAVMVTYSNGTTRAVPDEYVAVDRSLGTAAGAGSGSTTVRVEEFPLNGTDPAAAEFRFRVANAVGVGEARTRVRNPTFNGTLPQLDSVRLSSLHPTAGDRVTVETNGKAGTFDRLADATVYDPDGTTIQRSTVTESDEFEFTPNQSGQYKVRLTLESPGGTQATETVTLQVSARSQDFAPTARAASGPSGNYLVVGDGFTGGSIDVSAAQDEATIAAHIAQDGEVPPVVHVYTEGLGLAPTSTATVRVLRGESGEDVSGQRVGVVVHRRAMDDTALQYRVGPDGDLQPITGGEGTQFGAVRYLANGTSIRTYTDSSGTVTLRTLAKPSRIQRALFRVRQVVPFGEVDAPVITVLPRGSPVTAGAPGSALVLVVVALLLVGSRFGGDNR